MAWRYHGRAAVDPDSPRAWATCDRCSMLYNLNRLHWQNQWSGRSIIQLHLLVCDDCLDIPAPFLRTPVLPPDPPPIFNARVEPYSIDETDWRVTTTPEIRETEDLANLRIVEADVETSTIPPIIPAPPVADSWMLASDGNPILASDGQGIAI